MGAGAVAKKLLVRVRCKFDFGFGCGFQLVRVRFGSAVKGAVLNSLRGSSSYIRRLRVFFPSSFLLFVFFFSSTLDTSVFQWLEPKKSL